MSNHEIAQKLWNLCDVLRDDGINYSDYVTELVLLLFIKMEFENTKTGILKYYKLPESCRWPDLSGKSGLELLNEYKQILSILSTGKIIEKDQENENKTIVKNRRCRLATI